ncbi:FbpB family small basic protein [Rossellomorea vietnamensis]|uniref:FbpB family small basic protein n=2 Tax=Rossellomorea TaxID=2837508 RepID=A0A5D4KJ47_9BACI|nr:MULTISPECIES: FbpB family small basic protein [Rossellomorea]TYR77311.1 FbpB family small basic protein [Rossellomorea vietnamensis]TYS17642.1 FbpB family small basic protein [Rossellomorea vietnamensis]TYS78147.1 FbpB family small basic protein [Rossellomorea aquimaris]
MKKGQLTIDELVKINKEELLKDKVKIEKIELRLEEKYMKN